MKRKGWLDRFLDWRIRHINDQQFMILVGVVVGLGVGFSAVIIKNTVYFIEYLLTHNFDRNDFNFLYLAFPSIGITLAVVFSRFILRKRIGHGVPSVLYAISRSNGRIRRHNMFSSVITSALTVGFGGSVGLEGPTVATGAAIGSNLGRRLRLNQRQVISMLGFACAGAMASIFKAPIAAIVFALEVIMIGLTMSSLVPLLAASVSAALTSYFFLGQDVLYPFEVTEGFQLNDTVYYVAFGILAGLVSVYFARTYITFERLFSRIKNWYNKLLIGGLSLGILIFFFPSLYGEGYEAINSCLQGDYNYLFDNSIFSGFRGNMLFAIALVLVIVLFKVVATSLTFGAGGIGGIFAPTLFMGAHIGLFFALLVNYFGMGDLITSNFALVGMAGLIAGVLHAPLTAIFLIAEITGGYKLFMPLMIVATISYATVRVFLSNSVYTYQLARRGELITHHKDKAVLTRMSVKNLIETNFVRVAPEATLRELVKAISSTHRNIFPVTDEENHFLGIVRLDDIRETMFRTDLYDSTRVHSLMYIPEVLVDLRDTMEEVAEKFKQSGKYNMVVLDQGKYLGFVSRANVFSEYRNLLQQYSEE
jgi:CIC family chloride channel protein